MLENVERGDKHQFPGGSEPGPVRSFRALNGTSNGGHRGPNPVDLPGTGYIADIYFKTPYASEKERLVQTTEEIVANTGLWLPDEARSRILSISEASDPANTSWIGFRKADAPAGQYDGLAWQEILYIPTVRGVIPLLFMRLRAFLPEAQGKHLGRSAMQLAINTHSYAEPTHIAHRTGSPAAVRSWLEADVFRPGRRFPYDLSYDKDFVAFYLMMSIYDLTNGKGRIPNRLTGVSIGEYSRQNGAYIPDPNHNEVMRIQNWMEEKLRMNFLRGDALIEVGELGKKH